MKTFGLQRSFPWNNNAPFRKGHQQGLRYSQCSQSGLQAQLQLSRASIPWAALYKLLPQCPHHGKCRSSGRSAGFSAGLFTGTQCLLDSKMRMVSSPFHPHPNLSSTPVPSGSTGRGCCIPSRQDTAVGSPHPHQVWHEEQM